MKLNCGRFNTSFEHNHPQDFLQSQWQTREKSIVYLIYRWAIACFFIFSVSVSMVRAVKYSELHVYFIYLTNWNLVFTMISAVWNAWLVTLHHLDRFKVKESMTKELKVSWFLSTSTNMYAVLVSLIYWVVLYKTELNTIDLNNIMIHATNSLVPMMNLFIVKQPERFGLFIYPLCCGCGFLFFTWLYPALGGKNRRGQNFIYPILDWKEKPVKALIVAFGVTVSGAIVHSLVYGIFRLKIRIYKKYFAVKEEKADVLLTC